VQLINKEQKKMNRNTILIPVDEVINAISLKFIKASKKGLIVILFGYFCTNFVILLTKKHVPINLSQINYSSKHPKPHNEDLWDFPAPAESPLGLCLNDEYLHIVDSHIKEDYGR
jgi:hypothetical protein